MPRMRWTQTRKQNRITKTHNRITKPQKKSKKTKNRITKLNTETHELKVFPLKILLVLCERSLSPRGVTLGLFGWSCAAGTLKRLAYTRASSGEFCYPRLNSPNPPYARLAVFQKELMRSLAESSQNKTGWIF